MMSDFTDWKVVKSETKQASVGSELLDITGCHNCIDFTDYNKQTELMKFWPRLLASALHLEWNQTEQE